MFQTMLQQSKKLNDLSQPLIHNSPISYFSMLIMYNQQFTLLSLDKNKFESSFYDTRCYKYAKRISALDTSEYQNHKVIVDLCQDSLHTMCLRDEYAHYYRLYKNYKTHNDSFVVFNFAADKQDNAANHYYVNQMHELDQFCDYAFNSFVGFARDNHLSLNEFPANSVFDNPMHRPLDLENEPKPLSKPKSNGDFVSPLLFKLTKKERSIINYTAMGMTSKQISEKMFLSSRTVENHLYNIRKKLGVKVRKDELVLYLTGKMKKYVDAF